jgi:hypothetical protein
MVSTGSPVRIRAAALLVRPGKLSLPDSAVVIDPDGGEPAWVDAHRTARTHRAGDPRAGARLDYVDAGGKGGSEATGGRRADRAHQAVGRGAAEPDRRDVRSRGTVGVGRVALDGADRADEHQAPDSGRGVRRVGGGGWRRQEQRQGDGSDGAHQHGWVVTAVELAHQEERDIRALPERLGRRADSLHLARHAQPNRTYVRDVRRLINRSRQGDLGEASAIEWLTSVGARVLVPFGHSPDYDLVADANDRLLRIQVKTSIYSSVTPDGHGRHAVALATGGGNRSWSGVTKPLEPSRVDYVFALTGDGRRWFIPSTALEAVTALSLGGPKYSEFEIEPGRPIRQLVYGEEPALQSIVAAGEYPSGQRMATVNRPAQPSQVRILPPPFRARPGFQPSRYDRKLGRSGQAIVNAKRRVTLPRQACIEASLQPGDRLHVRSDGEGRVVLERIEPPPKPN